MLKNNCLLDMSGNEEELSRFICVERKMNLDELCQCFTTGRGRFQREFERATEKGSKVWLLIERGNWEKVLAGTYRSKFSPSALSASLLAWTARYNLVPLFCQPETTGRLIGQILRYETKILLESGKLGEDEKEWKKDS